MTKLPRMFYVGIGLIAAGVLWSSGWDLWKRTLIWTPLDVPISLAKGRFRTAAFRVNVEATYSLQLVVSQDILAYDSICESAKRCAGRFADLPLNWTVFQGDREIARGSDLGGPYDRQSRELGRLEAAPGEYVLELELPRDGSLYDAASPHLVVDDHSDWAYWVTQENVERNFHLGLFSILVGVYLAARELNLLRYGRSLRRDQLNRLTQTGPLPPLPPQDAVAPRTPQDPPAFWRSKRVWAYLLVLVAAAVISGTRWHWMATRTFDPVDLPVRLDGGSIQSGLFSINLPGLYEVLVKTTPPDPNVCNPYGVYFARWILYRNGVPIEEADGPAEPVLLFDLSSTTGTYNLVVQVSNSDTCLNSAHPRIHVGNMRGGYDAASNLLYLICIFAAAVCVAAILVEGQRIFHPLAPDRRPRRERAPQPLRIPPEFSLLAANVFLYLAAIVMILHDADYWPSHGLLVRITPVTARRAIGIQPVLVKLQLVPGARLPRVFIGSRRVTWEDLHEVLIHEIAMRPPEWPVYIEADPEMSWSGVAAAIDAVQGVPAATALLTHRTAEAVKNPGKR